MSDVTTSVSGAAASAPRRRLLILLHGARIYDKLVREAIKELQEQQHEVTVRVTWESGDVERLVQEAALLPLLDGATRFDTIVAGGGDGTLNELVAALLRPPGSALLSEGAGTTVAQLPLGTANDLASASGISLDPREALALAVDPGAARPVDVALINGEVFLNLATVGPVSEVSSKGMSDAAKAMLGPAAIVVTSIRQLFVTGLHPKQGVSITCPLDASVRPPPPPCGGLQQCPPVAARPPTKVLADAGLAKSGALYGGGVTIAPLGGPGTAAARGPAAASAEAKVSNEPPAASATPDCGDRHACVSRGAGAGPEALRVGPGPVGAGPVQEIEPASSEATHSGGASLGDDEDTGDTCGGAGSRLGGAPAAAAPSSAAGGEVDLAAAGVAEAVEAQAAGVAVLQGDLLALVAGQSRQMGRMINVCPHALLDDGMLDFTVLFGTPGQQAARLVANIATHGLSGASGGILTLRGPWLLVEAAERLKTNRDGEPTLESSRLLFEVLPKAIRLHLPDERLLVSGLPEGDRGAAASVSTPARPKHGRAMLRDLLRAQQPPGRMKRRLAGLRRLAVWLLGPVVMFGMGFMAGTLSGARP